MAPVAAVASTAFAAVAAWQRTAAIATARKLGRPSVDRPSRSAEELLTSSTIGLHRLPRPSPGQRRAADGASGNRRPYTS